MSILARKRKSAERVKCVLFMEEKRRKFMARGSKKKYTSKQKRKASKIERGYKKRGVSSKEAERRAWATVNKSDKGGKKSGSGRGKKSSKASARKGGRKGGKSKRR
jgi:plasmid stabilization system protein ParE